MIKLIKESMDGKDVISKIEYIRDSLDELEKVVNSIGSIPEDLGVYLDEMYSNADMIYENTNTMIEATSGIGNAYTIKSIDIIEKSMKEDISSAYDEYILKIKNEYTKIGLVHLLHEIRTNDNLTENDKKELEILIKKKLS